MQSMFNNSSPVQSSLIQSSFYIIKNWIIV